MEKRPDSLLSLSFFLFPNVKQEGGRHSWDPVTALYCVEGCREFLTETERGVIHIDADGRTTFTPDENGSHSVVYVKQKEGKSLGECQKEIADYIDTCSMDVYSM